MGKGKDLGLIGLSVARIILRYNCTTLWMSISVVNVLTVNLCLNLQLSYFLWN